MERGQGLLEEVVKSLNAFITNVETGETRLSIESDAVNPQEQWPPFIWTDGNYSCDCNRALFFARAKGEPDPEEIPCGESKFRVRLEQGEYVYDERNARGTS